MNKKTSLMVICVQKITLVTKRVQNENYVTIIGHFPKNNWSVGFVKIVSLN